MGNASTQELVRDFYFTGTELLTLKGHDSRVRSIAFSPDGKRVVTGRFDKTAKIWDAVDWTFSREDFKKQELERYQAWLKQNAANSMPPHSKQ